MAYSNNFVGVYKEMEISYEELDMAMTKLGFQKNVARTKDSFREEFLKRKLMHITYTHPKKKLQCSLFDQPEGRPVLKHEIVQISDLLYTHEIIKDFDDLAKMVEKDRMKQQATA